MMEIVNCPDACERAWWYPDPAFPPFGQYNCPYRYGVDHCAAIIDGKVRCKHFKRKKVD